MTTMTTITNNDHNNNVHNSSPNELPFFTPSGIPMFQQLQRSRMGEATALVTASERATEFADKTTRSVNKNIKEQQHTHIHVAGRH